MESLYANNDSVHNNSSNQPDSAENFHSPSVQYETVTRHQQYESIVDTECEQLTVQYKSVHYNTLEHIDDAATQVDQLEDRPTAGCWVNNVDEDGYLQVLCDEQIGPFNAEGQLQVPNGNELALSEPSVECNQRVQQVAGVSSYGYLHPVGNTCSGTNKVRALSLASVDSNIAFSADPDTGNQLNSLNTAQDQGNTPPNPLYTAQDNTPPNPLYTAQDDTPPNPLYIAQDQDDTSPNPLYTTQDDAPPNPLYTAQGDTPPNPLRTVQNHENRPQLPAPRNNNQPTSGLTIFNSKLPRQLRLSR
jgi:hypothetical protein